WLRQESPVTTTTLPQQLYSATPEVGPLTLTTGAHLKIITPEFSAELDDSGAGSIIRLDPSKTPPEPFPQETLSLDRHTMAQLLLDLGRLKASWSARKVGEAALSPDLRDLPQEAILDESDPVLVIEEVMPGSASRTVLQLTAASPEYRATWDALTPLRLR
ncbi:MAG: hypothetical protein AAB229_09210, partial [Candidatus Hydrogenedentota bacterium]